MAKQRRHQGLRADGKLRKGFKYSGKRNKNGTARIVKVVQKKKMKGGIFGFKRGQVKQHKISPVFSMKPTEDCKDARFRLKTILNDRGSSFQARDKAQQDVDKRC